MTLSEIVEVLAMLGNTERIREIDQERHAHDPADDEMCICWRKAQRDAYLKASAA